MSRRDWYAEHEGPAEEHAVDIEVQARLEHDPEYQELRAQVRELGGMLSHLLDGEALDLWLRVETALNDRWAIFAGGGDVGHSTFAIRRRWRPMRILVIEDEPKVARALEEGLTQERYDVCVATTGEEGFYELNAMPSALISCCSI